MSKTVKPLAFAKEAEEFFRSEAKRHEDLARIFRDGEKKWNAEWLRLKSHAYPMSELFVDDVKVETIRKMTIVNKSRSGKIKKR